MLQTELGPNEAADRATPHVVVVDDDAAIRALIARTLREDGYAVSIAGDADELEAVLVGHAVDLIVLDVMMPGRTGLEVCAALRERSHVPVIIVSARDREADRVAGLDCGADDYLPKPFGRAELLARVRAVLRRAQEAHRPLNVPAPDRFDFAGWTYRARARRLTSPEGAEVDLTDAEHDLLLTLLRHPQRMIGRERLLELCRGRAATPTDRSIDVLVSRLRRKLGDGRRREPLVRTIRGIGYMLATDVASA